AAEARRLLGITAGPVRREPGADEFGDFVSDVAVTVGRAVEAWRARVAEAILRWEGEGYRVGRLEAMLEHETPPAVDEVIRGYERDVERLRALEAEVAQLDGRASGQSVFRDPDRLAEAEETADAVRAGVAPPPGPSPAFPLDTFAAGPSNRVALRAVQEVLGHPGRRYNPLVLVGPSGTGKTHLLHAVGLELGRRPGAAVACLSATAFVDELIAAIDGDRVDWWRARYRRATALLLDDIHMIAGKDRTQEELFNLFNLFLDQERQLVCTTPGHPNTLSGVEERIVSRLAGGLVAELGEPDRAVRHSVVERLLRQYGMEPDTALLDYLADRPEDSVRSVAGMVQRCLDAAAHQDQPLRAGLAREILEGDGGQARSRSAGFRTSGIVVSSAGGVRSREKMVWDWPDITERVIDEGR
ncbi:MAG: DnaA ATPase domain-containing protein, partial [Acidimicrobiales bacterium]